MRESFYLVDPRAGVQPLTSYLSKPAILAGQPVVDHKPIDTGIVERIPTNTGIVPPWLINATPVLPLTPDGQLLAGTLYPSSGNANERFYLPEYQLAVAGGRYLTSLKWRGPTDDPNGPLAYLTVEIAAKVPAAGTFQLREIPHQAVVRIVYRMPVQGQPAQLAPVPFAEFLGNWVNVDPNTNGMTRLEILPGDSASVVFHGFGKCQPQDCDWKLTPATPQGQTLIGTYDFGFKSTRITVQRSGANLTAVVVDDYTVADGRTDRTSTYTLAGGGTTVSTDGGRPLLSVEVGALNPTSTGTRQARLAVTTKPDFDRLYQVLTDASFEGRLQIRCFSTAGRRTFRQVLVAPVNLLSTKLIAVGKSSPGHAPGEPSPSQAGSEPASGEHQLQLLDMRTLVSNPPVPQPDAPPGVNTVGTRAGAFAAVRIPATVEHGTQVAVPLRPAGVGDAAVTKISQIQPGLQVSAIVNRSDLVTKVGEQTVQAVPGKVVVDPDGQPALMQIAVETLQEIAPFSFPVATNAYMFDIPGDMRPTTNQIFIRMEVLDSNGKTTVFYQDSGYADRFYYQPEQFLIPRVDTAPYLPDLRVVFFDLLTTDAGATDGTGTIHYKVQMAYRLVPDINPVLLDLVQAQVPNVKARFQALAPERAALKLRVPEDETNGALTDVPRPDAVITFDEGIVDQVELTRTEFERIFAVFQSPSGIGLEGSVAATLPGSVTANVPVRLSLRHNPGNPFNTTYLGPQTNGLHRVRVVNRLESPVTITALHRVTLGTRVFAYPQSDPGMMVQPAAATDLDYRVDPADASVVTITPAMEVTIQANPQLLWPQLFVNQGYTSDTFPLHVALEPGFLGVTAPGRTDPLTGVVVEFDSGLQVTLNAAQVAADIRLPIPLLPRLLGSPQAKQYRYRTVNLIGSPPAPDPPSEWMDGEGEAPLSVTPTRA